MLPWDASPNFKGRRDVLQEMHETFFGTGDSETDSHRGVIVTYGDVGMGKTEVALKYARENEFRYNYIFFAEATTTEILNTEIASICATLNICKTAGREIQHMQEFLRNEEAWLFIFDNDNDFLALNQLRLPEVDHGHVIITCRSHDNRTDPRINKFIQLHPLDPLAAVDLWFSRTGIETGKRSEHMRSVKAIVNALGCVPAMVENTAGYATAFEADPGTCLRLINSRTARPGIFRYYSRSSRYKMSAESLFGLRIESLKSTMPTAYTLLQILIWLDRTKPTTSFLARAASKQQRWGSNGEVEWRDPVNSGVAPDLIELINGPGFAFATKNLKSSSLIAEDERFKEVKEDMAPKDSIVLQSSLYQYLRDLATSSSAVIALQRAAALIAQAHPVSEAGLEERFVPQREILTRLTSIIAQQC
jgi:hypothetical protein